jgi:KipI family sensor histidine kinase inhibitor
MTWQRVGEDAFLTRLEARWMDAIDARAALRTRLARASSVHDFILTENALLVCARAEPELEALFDAAWLDAPARAAEHLIDVHYAGEDLAQLAHMLSMSQYDVINLHTASSFRVSFNGFLPGFAYLRGLHSTLASVPRRASPRPRVPAHSVAIAAGMSAVYPAASPGGWHLLGQAVDFDVIATPLLPGDRVRFRATERLHVENLRSEVEMREGLRVDAVRGIALIVDGVALRSLHQGVAPGGPLLPQAAMRANAAVGNDASCSLLERIGDLTLSLSPRMRTRRIANEHGDVTTLSPGESITLPWRSSARVGYIAIEGGLDVPHVLGGRGTLLSIRAGGLDGRPLRKADCIALGEPSSRPTPKVDAPKASTTFSLVPCSDFPSERARIASMLTSNLKVAHSSDRTGTRIVSDAPHLHVDANPARISLPIVRGSVQLTPAGELIVMGPDHPITGGYPLIGYVAGDDLEALFALPPGSPVHFALRDL